MLKIENKTLVATKKKQTTKDEIIEIYVVKCVYSLLKELALAWANKKNTHKSNATKLNV